MILFSVLVKLVISLVVKIWHTQDHGHQLKHAPPAQLQAMLARNPGQWPAVLLFLFPRPSPLVSCLGPSTKTDQQLQLPFTTIHIPCGNHRPSSQNLPPPTHPCILVFNTSRHSL